MIYYDGNLFVVTTVLLHCCCEGVFH